MSETPASGTESAPRAFAVGVPLYAQIVLYLLLNFVLLVVGAAGILYLLLGPGFASPLLSPLSDRAISIASSLSDEMADSPRNLWDDVLAARSAQHGVNFTLFEATGEHVAGSLMLCPKEVLEAAHRDNAPLARRNPRPDRPDEAGPRDGARDLPRAGPRNGAPDGQVDGQFENQFDNQVDGQRDGPPPREGPPPRDRVAPPRDRFFMVRAGEPRMTMLAVRIPVPGGRAGRAPQPGLLLAVAPSTYALGIFMGAQWYLFAAVALMAASALFWWPFVARLTRTITRLTGVTEHIARGEFQSRAPAAGNDELGRLGLAVNNMSARLEGFVQGQKRFVGDVAHELCSPLSRLQFAIGILEERAAVGGSQEKPDALADIRDEVQQLSDLVQELLMFSKAAVRGPELVGLSPVHVAELVARVVAREHADQAVTITVAPDLTVLAEPGLLARALANLVRNSCRYAAGAGPILLSAAKVSDLIQITITDRGPGVPTEALAHLGDPFFRPDLARQRETGGTGLGLAIVKTCIEACRGKVMFKNVEPVGFEARIELPAA